MSGVRRGALLVAVIAWVPPGGDLAERRAPRVVRGEAGPVLVDSAGGPNDLLVVGSGRRGVRRALARSVSRYCVAHARCPVMAVPPSDLMEAAARGQHRWPLRHRTLVPDAPEAWLGRR